MKEGDPFGVWSRVWDVEQTADSLKAEVELDDDIHLRYGYRLRLSKANAQLALYPDLHALKLRIPYVDICMSDVTAVQPLVDKVKIEASDAQTKSTLVIQANGTIFFTCADKAPAPGPGHEPAPQPPIKQPRPPHEEQQQDSYEEQTPIQAEQDEKERPFRFTGRIGKIIESKTSIGKLKVILPLGVKSGEDTVWHRIVFWEEKAKQILETRKTGEMVTCVFYEHPPREVVTKNGVRKLVPDLRGAAIYTPKDTK